METYCNNFYRPVIRGYKWSGSEVKSWWSVQVKKLSLGWWHKLYRAVMFSQRFWFLHGLSWHKLLNNLRKCSGSERIRQVTKLNKKWNITFSALARCFVFLFSRSFFCWCNLSTSRKSVILPNMLACNFSHSTVLDPGQLVSSNLVSCITS